MAKKRKNKPEVPRGPWIIALETATPISSVALFEGSHLVGIREYHTTRTHARLATPMIEGLLTDMELTPADLAAVAVAKGPGSYTGLRVGVSTAKGLAMALDIPLLSIDSLEALAWQVAEMARETGAQIVPMIDARRMEVYTSRFTADMVRIDEVSATIVEEDTFVEVLKTGPVLFVGNGAEKCREILGTHPNAMILSGIGSSARGMGPVLLQKFEAESFENLVTFEPFYLKEFVAILPKNKLKQS